MNFSSLPYVLLVPFILFSFILYANNTWLLPEFQVQVLIHTGDSGSNPERALYRQISLVVTVRGYGIETLEPVQNIRQLSSW